MPRKQPKRRSFPNAATYVEITRADLEAWLDSLGHPWSRDPVKTSIYFVKIGPNVAIKVMSTLASSDKGVAVGEGSMHLALVSTLSGKTINKKAEGQKGFHRTTNWRDNWRKGIDRMTAEYEDKRAFYDQIANADPAQNARAVAMIESIPGWENNSVLAFIHKRAKRGDDLSQKSFDEIEAAMVRTAPRLPSPPPQRPTAPVAPAAPGPVRAVAPDAYDPRDGRPVALREAYAIAKQVGKPEAAAFARLLATQIADGVPTTEAQLRMVRAMLKDFGVPFYYPTDAEVEAALGPLRRRAATNGRKAARRSAAKARKASRSRR